MKTIGEKYGELRAALARSAEAEAEAARVLSYTQGIGPGGLRLRFGEPCAREGEIDEIARKRAAGMPLAYALHSKPFYGYEFYVDENVLIPRFDSEPVAERAIALVNARRYKTALDLCCGSGNLGVALLLESGVERVCFGDVSAGAVAVAERNARRLAGERFSRCAFVCGDLFAPVEGAFDLIVCNPPYISPDDYAGLEEQIVRYEPKLALTAENGGYAFYERLARESPARLLPGGSIVLETGDTQGEKVAELFAAAGFADVSRGTDLCGRQRVVTARLE